MQKNQNIVSLPLAQGGRQEPIGRVANLCHIPYLSSVYEIINQSRIYRRI